MSFSYVDSQFEDLRLDRTHEYPPKMKVVSDFGETKWMDVKASTMQEIQALLKRDEDEEEKA